ncbi:MAG: hypothetical protein ACI8R9_002823, partial [Paraglaciecola sp.]
PLVIILLLIASNLSGCVIATVASVAVGVTTTVVGGAIDVVDAVTPDIIDDEDEEQDIDD